MPIQAARSPVGLVSDLYQMGMTTPPFWTMPASAQVLILPRSSLTTFASLIATPRVGKISLAS
jgi:hypothetical protein